MTEKKSGSAFRSWLVERLSASRFASYRDDTDEEIAKRIGVRVDVLVEARELFLTRESKPDGRRSRLGMPRAKRRSRYHIHLEPPEPIYLEWRAQCKQRQQTNACLLRSVVHHVLRLKVQPSWLSSRRNGWYYRGGWHGQRNIREHEFRMKTDLGEPCYRALTERANATGVSASAIARWGVTAFLEGKFRNFMIVSSIEALYNHEARYITRPRIALEL